MGNYQMQALRVFTELTPRDKQCYDEILERVATGENLADICPGYGMSVARVLLATQHIPYYAAKFEAARAAAAEIQLGKIVTLADHVETGELAPDICNASFKVRSWVAEKLNPRVFGSKQETTVISKAAPAEMTFAEKLEHLRRTARAESSPIDVTATASTPSPDEADAPPYVSTPTPAASNTGADTGSVLD